MVLAPHPVREALLELIRRDGVVTATEAAHQLGGSTGLYSFHLRQLARYGVIEEAPAPGGRVRPWPVLPPRGPLLREPPRADPAAWRRSLLDHAVPGQLTQMEGIQACAPAQLASGLGGGNHALAADQLQQRIAPPAVKISPHPIINGYA